MRIQVECLGSLRARQPSAGWVQLAEPASVADLFVALNLTLADVQVTRIDGRFEHNPDYLLREGQSVSILPYTFAHASALSDAGA